MLNKLLPLLVGLALLIFTLGLSLFYIEGQFALLSLSLASFLTFSGTTLLVGLLLLSRSLRNTDANSMQVAQASNRSRWKKVAIVFAMVTGSIVFLGISHYGANSIPIRWDVTAAKQHTLSKNTVDFISSLTTKVELTAFYVGMPPKYLQDLFNEYERLSAGLISTQIIDPIENISFAAKFGNVVSGKERKVIVQSGDVRKDVDFTDELLAEEKLTNTIARASRSPRQVYFLSGHGEYSISNEDNLGLSTFKQLLADNNIHSKALMLGITQSIPADCDVLIIAGPRTELTPQEESLIVDYLKAGGDALFLIEQALVTTADKPLTAEQQRLNPSLNSILNQWGLNVQSDIVVDLANHIGDDVGSPATKNYQKHKAITQGLDYTFYVRPRSIRLLEQRRPTIKVAAITLTTSTQQSWAETNRELDIQFDPGVDTPGPVPISYVVLEQHPEKHNGQNKEVIKPSDTRIIVFTDADFLTNIYINQYSNAQMGLNVVNWLAELDYRTFVSSNKVKVERLDLTSKQKRQIMVILFLLPFFFVIAGGIVWLRLRSIPILPEDA
ncbi:GldG family protein [Shewanella abyssi]|uniref:GldG family protein n=1 Tax=Shewanella abyssi TaxID=311789 RepID=UPI00200C5B45|nr:GldG family protein [Shewanella abyssi]MCL1051069.1 GldG family protein [Shewanella abyssi]